MESLGDDAYAPVGLTPNRWSEKHVLTEVQLNLTTTQT
jgi:hypothetical protein